MKLHGNARLTPRGRKLLVERVCSRDVSLQTAALSAGVSTRTASKWVARYRAEGELGLLDRSAAPHRVPGRTPEARVVTIAALRRLRFTAAEIAEVLGMALSTVSAVLLRIGLGKRSRLEPPEPPNRYERQRPGELIHIDVKKLGRIDKIGHRISGSKASQDARSHWGKPRRIGWEYVHVCVDDATRLAYVEVLDDEKGHTTAGFLRRAVAFYASYGITIERVMTDNGAGYRSIVHALACRTLGLRHLRTRPYRPRTNGKAERFIRTMLGGWAYGAIYGSSAERTRALAGWLDHYNRRRPHGSLSRQTPLSRLTQLRNNVPGTYARCCPSTCRRPRACPARTRA
jgi:transposase InsO family protein